MKPVSQSRGDYRPDIDGLRALAVLLVVLDHLRTRIAGGYVGVDVFFVISGHLISGHILRELRNGTFSSLDFYERRVRRILPAVLVLLAVCSAVAYILLLPTETENFAHTMLASLYSWANIYFFHDSGYFAPASTHRPLLHLWSLGVEEQFYIVFPLLLIAVWKFAARWLKPLLWVLMLLSFFAACWYVRHNTIAAFFLLPLRAWELLLGALLSQTGGLKLRTAWTRNLGSALGLLLVLGPAVAYTATTPFPGMAALPVCLGAALVIASGETGTSLCGQILSSRPAVWIGRISYSLYLWHWPVIVFGIEPQLAHGHVDARNDKIIQFAASLALGALSWAFVEQPFRTGRIRPQRRTLFAVAGSGVLALTVLGVAMLRTQGFAFRFPAETVAILDYPKNHPNTLGRIDVCFIVAPATFDQFDQKTCLHPPQPDSHRPEVLLFGDSLAAHMYPGLAQTFPEWNLTQITSAGCRPVLNPKQDLTPDFLGNCHAMQALAFGDYLIHDHPARILLAGTWSADTLPDLTATLAWFHAHRQNVVLVGPMPDYDGDLPTALAWAFRSAHPDAVLATWRRTETRALDLKMKQMAADTWHVPYVSAFDTLCSPANGVASEPQSGDGCPVLAAPGVPLLSDWHHLTVPGSVVYAQAIRRAGALQ